MCATVSSNLKNEYSFSNIELREQLPSGANGTVFLGYDVILKREIVVKLWIKQKTGDTRNKNKQALAESEKLAKLDHPNIVKVHYGRIENDQFYLVMEYVPGTTLNEKLQKGEIFTFRERRNCWYAIVEALSHAYSQNVYHGDLHDKNILIAGEITKLIDFGTSVFCKQRIDSKERETRLISKLLARLFPDISNRLTPEDKIIKTTPEIFLHVCDARFQINQCLKIIYESLVDIEKNSFQIRSEILGMSRYISIYPFFDIRAIVNEMARKNVPDYFIRDLLNSCITCSKLNISESLKPIANTEHMMGSTEEYLEEIDNWQCPCEEKLFSKYRNSYQSLLEYIS